MATLATSASPALARAKFKDGIKLTEQDTMTTRDETVAARARLPRLRLSPRTRWRRPTIFRFTACAGR
jgi:hypothetical protein